MATYTAALLCDTAVPAWHEGYREMPFLFAGSAASAAGGLGLLAVPRPLTRGGQVRRARGGGRAHRQAPDDAPPGQATEPYQAGRPGRLMEAGEVPAAAGLAGAAVSGRNRLIAALSGAALLGGSALTRFGVFEAGRASARDPKYTVGPQRERLAGGGARPVAEPVAGRAADLSGSGCVPDPGLGHHLLVVAARHCS